MVIDSRRKNLPRIHPNLRCPIHARRPHRSALPSPTLYPTGTELPNVLRSRHPLVRHMPLRRAGNSWYWGVSVLETAECDCFWEDTCRRLGVEFSGISYSCNCDYDVGVVGCGHG